MVERGGSQASLILRELHRPGTRPWVIGLTGPPGTGKSTLADALATRMRDGHAPLAIVAVDPSSPFSGGAILGDRVRMQRHAGDPNVYIRSMGARGHLGGLSTATRSAIRLLGYFGFRWVLVETVGVGQSELEIASLADTTVVVTAPGLGDGIQAMKAGLLEVADLVVMNKRDLDGAERAASELRRSLGPGRTPGWKLPIIQTAASTGEGVVELLTAIEAHRSHLEATGEAPIRARGRLVEEVADLVAEDARQRARARCEREPELLGGVGEEDDPRVVADRILGGQE